MRYILFIAIALAALVAACGDTPPTVPGNFTVNAVSASEISSTWSKSENSGGVDKYEIWRDSKYHDYSLTTGYMDQGLTNSTTYCYAVRAVGGSDDISDFTDTKCAKTFPYDDTEPPTIPTNLIANAISDTEIDLIWNTSTDDVRVAGYNIYRDNAFINAAISNMLTDTGLVNSTRYCYAVTAFDLLNQESVASNTDCEFTLAP